MWIGLVWDCNGNWNCNGIVIEIWRCMVHVMVNENNLI